jgi:inosine-uridine nucleoside N-ribohydrolase
MKKQIIIDTDFGGDPDDILALLYAVRSSEISIEAIISSDEYKNDYRAKSIQRWLKTLRKRIPIFAGKDLGNRNLFFLERYAAGETTPAYFLTSRKFLDIVRRVNADKGYYVAIGGLTNLSILLSKYPSYMSSLTCHIMGGTVFAFAQRGEHNARLNPTATRAVMASSLKTKWILADHTSVPAVKISPTHELYRRITAKRSLAYTMIRDNMDKFYATKYPESYVHDPIALSTLLLPVARFVKRHVWCTDIGVFKKNNSQPAIQMTSHINYKLFWKDFFDKLTI